MTGIVIWLIGATATLGYYHAEVEKDKNPHDAPLWFAFVLLLATWPFLVGAEIHDKTTTPPTK